MGILWSGYGSVAKEYWPMAQFTFINIEEGREATAVTAAVLWASSFK